jgi:release factor glutamine methyltransferase
VTLSRTTVAELLGRGVARLTAAGSETPRLDAELLLGHAVGADRSTILAHPEAPVGADAAATFEASLSRREAGEPVAYIRGFKEFFGLAFATDPRALIPRPATERLVELAEAADMRLLPGTPRPPGTPGLRIVDVGTGSGAVAVALAVRLRRRRATDDIMILATDISPDALELARENAVGHAAGDVVRFVEADILPPVVEPFDIVLANLPYVATEDVDELPVAVSFEPRVALDGGPGGLASIGRLFDRLPDALVPGGVAMFEIDAGQIDDLVLAASARLAGWTFAVEPDLSGEPRVAVLRRPSG